ncbi:MAG TPA: serine hydrolase [Ramlibacter sp.]|nr:serine hydrolase [Ramlibacter sp.]
MTVAAVLLAGALTAVLVNEAIARRHRLAGQETTVAVGPGQAERGAEAQPAEPPPPPGVEVVPEGENAPAPSAEVRQSFGRAAGLHRARSTVPLVSSAALAIDEGSGKVLVEKNPDAVLPIASLTKLMTALILAEAKLPLDETLTITEDDIDNERHSRSRLRVGTSLTRGEALHLALMSSENRAAHALGRTFPGGLALFINAMNNKARQLGMKNTSFVDPTGLSSRNQSTARDVATLALAASRHGLLRDYSTTPRHQIALGGRTLLYNNSNRLVKSRVWDIRLQKTGYIVEAGQCVAMHTRIGRRNVVMVLLDATDKKARSADAERIRRMVTSQADDGGDAVALHKDAART